MIKQEVDDPSGVLDAIEESDLQRVLDSGLVIETEFGQDLLQDMIPEDLPPTELTLELILPTWLQTATGEDSIVLVERTNGEDELNITLRGFDSYNPRHEILDSDGNQICSADEADWSCIESDMEFNIENMNFNEWGPSFEFDAGFSASFDFYRLKVPQVVLDELNTSNARVSMEAIPSDLLEGWF